MNVRSIVTLLVASLLPLDAVAQRIDLGLNGFEPASDTQVQIQGSYLVLITSSQFSGGAYRCVDFQGPARFGGIGFVPSRLPNGQPNRGSGAIGVVPYLQPGCTGGALQQMTGSPPFYDSTPRDVEFAIASVGTVPATTKSVLFLVAMTTTSSQPFQFCFRGPWLEATGAPDLDPDVTIHIGSLVPTDPGKYSLGPEGQALGQGDTLPRGRFLLMYVDVKNIGDGAANGWMAKVRHPEGWVFSGFPSNCSDFDSDGVHNATAALGPGETRRLCAALMPKKPAAAVRVSAETTVANDSNPANNFSSSDPFEVEAPRGADGLPPKLLNHLNGRR
jgi:hypothetical protein